MSYTTDPNNPDLGHGADTGRVPLNKVYLILSEEERAKGFIRPLRRSYIHVGNYPKYPLRDLTPEEHERYDRFGYVKEEAYPEGCPEKIDNPSVVGRFWTQADLDKKACQTVTRMGLPLCETYARDPKFYGSTYCVGCQKHLPVAEFKWAEDNEIVGS